MEMCANVTRDGLVNCVKKVRFTHFAVYFISKSVGCKYRYD